MNASTRFLRYAIGGSLMLHLAVALAVRSHPVEAAPEQQPRKIDVIHVVSTPTPPPPKVQTPPPSNPQPAQRRAAKPPTLSRHFSTHGMRTIAFATPATGVDGGPGVDPLPSVEPTARPAEVTPTVPPTPACTTPDVPARTIQAVTPEAPQSAMQEGLTGVADVRVDLAANGDVLAVSIYRSSGSPALDQAALRAARSSRYAPALEECRPAAGSYIFKAEFDN